jgi:putative ABC transport system permease protein
MAAVRPSDTGASMFLALKEMRRAKVRFGLLMGAIGLLVFLILFQQTVQYGLLDSFVGAVRNQSAPVLVFSVDGRRNLQASIITPPQEQLVRDVDAVARAGQIGERAFTVIADGELTQVAMIGYEVEGLGSPTTLSSGRLPTATGEVVASDVNATKGFALGQKVQLVPGALELTVVGLAADAQLLASPTLFTTYETYAAAVRSTNPDAGRPLPSAIGVEPVAGTTPEQLVDQVNAVDEDLDALTRAQAAEATPGVAQVRQSFQVIFALYGLVIPFVTGLFFLIITFQKANALTLLRALGAPRRRLVSALMIQVVVVIVVGVAVGTAVYAPLATRRLGTIALSFQAGAVVFWGVLLLALGVLSALFSARQVLRIDPMAATTGVGVDR